MFEIAKVVSAGTNTMVMPLAIPGTESGRITSLKTLALVAPKSYAASITAFSILIIELYIGSIIKGR